MVVVFLLGMCISHALKKLKELRAVSTIYLHRSAVKMKSEFNELLIRTKKVVKIMELMISNDVYHYVFNLSVILMLINI